MNWLAQLADEMNAGLYVGPFLALIFLAGTCLAFIGLILGLVRLAKKMSLGSTALPGPNDHVDSDAAGLVNSAILDKTGRKSKILVLASLISLCIITFALDRPYAYIAAEPCQVRITDQNHQPVPGLRVVKSWGFSLEHYGNQTGRTDSKGTVSFAPVSVEISLLKHLEMRWAPAEVYSWYPGRDSLPVAVYLPENLDARFDSESWRPVIPGDPTAYTNQFGVFVRYLGAYALANQNPNPAVRAGLRLPRPNNTVGVGFPDGVQAVDLQVGEKKTMR